MSAHIRAFLYCDSDLYDCPRDGSPFGVDDLPGSIREARRQALDAGWRRERRDGQLVDVCDGCVKRNAKKARRA
ncbi:MAG: hypothetical protein KGK07_14775 [Chloroflexota bacterium]|nr:hypothetical protein [Chloroflexota bacterium]